MSIRPRVQPGMKRAIHEEAGMHFISLALYHLVLIFRSVKSTGKIRNTFFLRQKSSHTLRGRFKGTPKAF